MARPAEWPTLPPLQRVVAGPSLVTDPDRFQRQLAAWSNPSFLSTPGHLVSPEAPSGTVSGLAVPDRGRSFDVPAADSWGAGPALTAAPSGPTAQRAAVDAGPPSPPPRRAPHVGPVPGPSVDLLSAASAAVPPPVERPAVPLPPADSAPRDDDPHDAAGSWQPVPTPAPDVQRQEASTAPAPLPVPAVQRSVPAPEPEVGPREAEPPEAPAPVFVTGTGPETPGRDAAPTSVLDQRPTLGDSLQAAPPADADASPRGDIGGAMTDPTPAAVQRLAPDMVAPSGSGRRRLGLGAPLTSVPAGVPETTPVLPRADVPGFPLPTSAPPSLDPPLSAVQRLAAPTPDRSASPSSVASGTTPTVQSPAIGTGTAPLAGAAPTGVPVVGEPALSAPSPVAAFAGGPSLQRVTPHASAPGASVVEAPAQEVPTEPTADTSALEAPAPAAAVATVTEPAADSAAAGVPTLGLAPQSVAARAAVQRSVGLEAPVATDSGPDLPRARTVPAQATDPATAGVPTLGLAPLSVAARAAVQRSVGPETPVATDPSPDLPPARPAPVPATEEAVGTGAADRPTAGAAGGIARESSVVDWSGAEPTPVTGTVGASAIPVVSSAAPLLQRTAPGPASFQRQSDAGPSAPTMGAAVQRAIHAGHAPIAATPVGPVSVVAQREQAPAGRSRAVPESGPLATAADPVAILSASTDRVLVDADGAAVDGDWPSLPGSGSSVGPVGSRPLQRSLAEAPAPAGRATDPSRLGIDLAGSGPVPRSGSAFSDTGSRHVDMSLPVSRLAAASSPASQVPGLPPTVRGAFAHAAAPLTLQTLSSADDAPPPAVPAPSTVVVERVASPADEAGEADGVPFAGFPPVTVARAVVQPLEEATGAPPAGGGAAAGGPAAVAAIAPGDVDALVRKLYDPLARRLRAELRLDRERIGRSLDLRH